MSTKNTINIGKVVDVINSIIPGDNTTTIRATRGDKGPVYEIHISIVELMRAAGLSNRQLIEAHAAISDVKTQAAMALAGNRKKEHALPCLACGGKVSFDGKACAKCGRELDRCF